MNKREFLRTAGGGGLSLLIGEKLWAQYAEVPVERLAEQEVAPLTATWARGP